MLNSPSNPRLSYHLKTSYYTVHSKGARLGDHVFIDCDVLPGLLSIARVLDAAKRSLCRRGITWITQSDIAGI